MSIFRSISAGWSVFSSSSEDTQPANWCVGPLGPASSYEERLERFLRARSESEADVGGRAGLSSR